MARSRRSSPARSLRRLWSLLAPVPGGKWLFSKAFGWIVPYTGSIGARVEALEAGHARLRLRDRRRVRNHLGSIHAVALANLGEATSGLAMTLALPDDVRGIVIRLTTEYRKKARGTLVAESRVDPPPISETRDLEVRAAIRDATGDVVAETTAVWRLEPRKPASRS